MSGLRPENYTMFPKSQPWGYEPEAVEKKIGQYENALSELNNRHNDDLQIIAQQEQRIDKLEHELKNLHFQLSSLELPDVEEPIEKMVIDEFKEFKAKDNSILFEEASTEEKGYKNDLNKENDDFIIAGDGSDEGDDGSDDSNELPFTILQ